MPNPPETARDPEATLDVPLKITPEADQDDGSHNIVTGNSDVAGITTAHTMRGRFEGASGVRRLERAIGDTALIRGDRELAAKIAAKSTLKELNIGDKLLEQDAACNDIYLIISGSVNILAHSRQVGIRVAGMHVGEMALIDPTARRSGTVIAREDTLLAKVTEDDFTDLASEYPDLWRRLAVEVCKRLHERNNLITPPRNQAVVFLGCSVEGLATAQAIQAGCTYDSFIVQLWTNNVFQPSETPMESLFKLINQVDFGVMVVTPDDQIYTRSIEILAPRDNVIFELGLLIGAIGRRRTVIVSPRGVELKIPTDLTGVTPITYPHGNESTLSARMGPVCTAIRQLVAEKGPI